jgi:hypothetical protein
VVRWRILHPSGLLLSIQRIKKVSGHRWCSNGTHGAKSSHGQRDVVPRREANDDDIFRKVQAISPDLNLICSGLGDKDFCFAWLQARFPNASRHCRRETPVDYATMLAARLGSRHALN